MRFTKKIGVVVLAGVVAAGSIAASAPQKADAANVTAYLCFASKSYGGVLSDHNDANRSKGVMNGNKLVSLKGITVKNATIKKGKFSVTVSATGKNLKTFSSEKGWNSIYVDTSLAGKKKSSLKVTKAVLKMDGKTVKTISNPALTPDPGKTDDFTQVMVLNGWNSYAQKKCKASSVTKMPTKSISVTITGTLK